MNRAVKNRVRGAQRSDPKFVPGVGTPLLLAQYNGRANLGAGSLDQRAIKPLQPDGLLASWAGSTPPNA